jgi:hypothetical protein
MCKDQPLVFSLVIPKIQDSDGPCVPLSATHCDTHGHGTRSSERQVSLFRLRYNPHRSFTNERIHLRFSHNFPLLFTHSRNYRRTQRFLEQTHNTCLGTYLIIKPNQSSTSVRVQWIQTRQDLASLAAWESLSVHQLVTKCQPYPFQR